MSDRPPTAPAIAALMDPPAASLTWKDFEPLAAKCAAIVKLEMDYDKAKDYAKKYSDRREDDGILALFCDGSGSGKVPVGATQAHLGGQECKIKPESRTWTSSAVVFRKNQNDKDWQIRGYPTPLLLTNNNAELDGFCRAMDVAEERLAVDLTLDKVLIFTDAQTLLKVILKMNKTHRLPDWDVPLLFKVMTRMAEVSENPRAKFEFHWQPAHCGVEGNEKADLAARLVRPDKLWPEAYPTETSNKNKSRRVGNMAPQSAQEDAVPTHTYQQQRKSNRARKHARKRVAQLSLQEIENLDPDVPISSIEEDYDGAQQGLEGVREEAESDVKELDPDVPMRSIEEDDLAAQKDEKETEEADSDVDMDDEHVYPLHGPILYELDRGWREQRPERKTKEEDEQEQKKWEEGQQKKKEEEEQKRKAEEDEELYSDPLYGPLFYALDMGHEMPPRGM